MQVVLVSLKLSSQRGHSINSMFFPTRRWVKLRHRVSVSGHFRSFRGRIDSGRGRFPLASEEVDQGGPEVSADHAVDHKVDAENKENKIWNLWTIDAHRGCGGEGGAGAPHVPPQKTLKKWLFIYGLNRVVTMY
jgi:hypothetical protein